MPGLGIRDRRLCLKLVTVSTAAGNFLGVSCIWELSECVADVLINLGIELACEGVCGLGVVGGGSVTSADCIW